MGVRDTASGDGEDHPAKSRAEPLEDWRVPSGTPQESAARATS